MTAIGSAAYGCWGSIITYSIIRRFFRRAAALLVAASAVMISNLHYFAFIRSRKEHTSEYFTVALLFWVFFRFRERGDRSLADYLFLGCTAGLMSLVRINNLVFCIIPLIFFIHELFQAVVSEKGRPGILLGHYAAAIASFVVCLSPMFIHAWLISESFFLLGGIF